MQSRKRGLEEEDQPGETKETKKQKSTSIYQNFTQGDLVFGLVATTDRIIKNLKKKHFHHITAQSLNSGPIEALHNNQAPTFDAEKTQHYHFLAGHKDYLFGRPGKPIHQNAVPVISSAYRRACKLLVSDRSHPRKIHILTKGLDWKKVFNKFQDAGVKNTGITSSEMRAIYRHNKTHSRNPNILFYGQNNMLAKRIPWELPKNKPYTQIYEDQRYENRNKGQQEPDQNCSSPLSISNR